MGKLTQGHFAILGGDIIKEGDQVCFVGNNRMPGIPFFKFQVIEERLDNWMGSRHIKE
jgi:hypothetical protein